MIASSRLFRPAFCALFATALSAPAATFFISQQTGLIAPSGRGGANTTFYGWDTFTGNPGDAGFPNLTAAINDSTPDLAGGANPGGALLVTTNGEDHISGSGNFYSASGSMAETVTFDTSGVLGTGFTTLILQGHTAFGPFGLHFNVASINGVAPEVIFGTNAAGQEQFWARWNLPGNQDLYAAALTSIANSNVSFDKLSVDTFWSAAGYQSDIVAAVPEPGVAGLAVLGLAAAMRRRRVR